MKKNKKAKAKEKGWSPFGFLVGNETGWEDSKRNKPKTLLGKFLKTFLDNELS